MKRAIVTLAVVSSLVVPFADAMAQTRRHGNYWGSHGHYQQPYRHRPFQQNYIASPRIVLDKVNK